MDKACSLIIEDNNPSEKEKLPEDNYLQFIAGLENLCGSNVRYVGKNYYLYCLTKVHTCQMDIPHTEPGTIV